MDPHEHAGEGVDLPIPTANPIIAAFGVTLLAAGIVTSLIVSLVGLIIGLIATAGMVTMSVLAKIPTYHAAPFMLVPDLEVPDMLPPLADGMLPPVLGALVPD